MAKIYVGTSGWSYHWNLGNSLEWYIKETGLNAIELNMSYYRFSFPNMVKSWVKKGLSLAWVIKVHRSITHYKKLNKESYPIFERFKKLFTPLEACIHYYLFQLPPKFTNLDRCEGFIEEYGNKKIAIEFRNISMFTKEIIEWGKKHNVLLVSIDAPKMPRIIMSKTTIYERIHGRTGWYSHDYSDEELQDIKARIMLSNPNQVYVFFNNNHAMLENAKRMYKLLR